MTMTKKKIVAGEIIEVIKGQFKGMTFIVVERNKDRLILEKRNPNLRLQVKVRTIRQT